MKTPTQKKISLPYALLALAGVVVVAVAIGVTLSSSGNLQSMAAQADVEKSRKRAYAAEQEASNARAAAAQAQNEASAARSRQAVAERTASQAQASAGEVVAANEREQNLPRWRVEVKGKPYKGASSQVCFTIIVQAADSYQAWDKAAKSCRAGMFSYEFSQRYPNGDYDRADSYRQY